MSHAISSQIKPYGLLRYAIEFANAAQLVKQQLPENKFSEPVYFLASHSIELSLKAFLLARGASLGELKSKRLGHKIGALLSLALAKHLQHLVPLNEDELGAIVLLGNHHETQRFRYIELGQISVPDWLMVLIVSQKLSRGLELFCLRRTLGKEAASNYFLRDFPSTPEN